jgi:hypothetical protein
MPADAEEAPEQAPHRAISDDDDVHDVPVRLCRSARKISICKNMHIVHKSVDTSPGNVVAHPP